MKFIYFLLLIFTSNFSLASDNTIGKNSKITLVDLLTCKVTKNEIRDNFSLVRIIKKYMSNNYSLYRDKFGGYPPKKEARVFNSKIISFKVGFGMSPGFSVTLGESLEFIRNEVESNHGIVFDKCEKNQCIKEVSKKETFAILQKKGITMVGCIFPYQT